MICPYCNEPANLVTGEVIYPNRLDLSHKKFYLCEPCNAYVGCHGKTDNPLGTLADKSLRAKRQECHRLFDTLWKDMGKTRQDGYFWLANQMRLPPRRTHIGMFDEEQCNRVIEICSKRLKPRSILCN